MARRNKKADRYKSVLRLLQEDTPRTGKYCLKVRKKSKPLDSYFYVEHDNETRDNSLLVVSEEYEVNYLSFLFNSSIGKELLFGEQANPYIENEISENNILHFEVVDVTKSKQKKYGFLEETIQELLLDNANSKELEKLVELRDALALELYDKNFFNEYKLNLYETWQESSFFNKKESQENQEIDEELSDFLKFINLMTDSIIQMILKKLK